MKSRRKQVAPPMPGDEGDAGPPPDLDDNGMRKGGRPRRKSGGAEGRLEGHRVDHRPRHASGGKWISGAIKHPGALHEQLGVPQGEKIPEKKLEKASHSDNPTLRRRANFAKELKSFH